MQSSLHNGLHRSSLPNQAQSITTSHQAVPESLQSPVSPLELRKRSIAAPSASPDPHHLMISDEEKGSVQANVNEIPASPQPSKPTLPPPSPPPPVPPPPPPPYPGKRLSLYSRFFCKPENPDPERLYDPANRRFSPSSRGFIVAGIMLFIFLAVIIGPVVGTFHFRNGTNQTVPDGQGGRTPLSTPNGTVALGNIGSTDSAFKLGPNQTVSLGLYTNFADPFIVQHEGLWYAFATNNAVGIAGKTDVDVASYRFDLSNVQVAVSSDFYNWNLTAHANEPLPNVGAWSDNSSRRSWPRIPRAAVWAPAVFQRPDKRWVMYYSARTNASDYAHCLGAAVSDSLTPAGPYIPLDEPFACPLDMGGAIDAAPFTDDNGDIYIVYKEDGNAKGHGGSCNNMARPQHATPIMLQKVASDGTTPEGEPVEILNRNTADRDGPLVEAPSLIKTPEGIYFLFFSSGCTADPSYNIKYAWSRDINGPYTRGKTPLLKTGKYNLLAPGSCTVARGGDGTWRMAFHARVFSMFGGVRMMFTSAVRFNGTTAGLYNPDMKNSTIIWNATSTRQFQFAPDALASPIRKPGTAKPTGSESDGEGAGTDRGDGTDDGDDDGVDDEGDGDDDEDETGDESTTSSTTSTTTSTTTLLSSATAKSITTLVPRATVRTTTTLVPRATVRTTLSKSVTSTVPKVTQKPKPGKVHKPVKKRPSKSRGKKSTKKGGKKGSSSIKGKKGKSTKRKSTTKAKTKTRTRTNPDGRDS
ncbi:hypothetical protein CAC42_4538 [Sphaceloma murrayae]|uniref:Uncharacterized protein n=1 Tax=Sphaceloma murrayae TaxID=2082308 RepID=A0A2K1QLV0_9PEZI|nr:hypothetical protein CAC42_4538 [Sphaceloma murrayae]